MCLGLMATMGCLWACGDHDAEVRAADFLQENDPIRIESFEVEHFFSDSGRVTAQMLAVHMLEIDTSSNDKKPSKTFYVMDQGVELRMLNQNGKPHTIIQSDSAIFSMEEQRGRLIGNVSIRTWKQETLETEELYWNKDADSIYTDKRVRIETPDKVIIGREGFLANTDFTGYTIYGIEGELETEEEI